MAINYSIKELKELANELTNITGLPYTEMTHSFFKRRLADVYDKLLIRKTQHFFNQLNDDSFIDALNNEFGVSTTELFRDPGFWRKLRSIIKDSDGFNSSSNLALIPQVTSGEELYSFLILLSEIDKTDQFKVLASFSSDIGLKKIKSGLLVNRKSDINPRNYKRFEGDSQLDNYFLVDECSSCVKDELLKNVVFEKGFFPNLRSDERASLILFRNKMLYYNKAYHSLLFKEIDRRLNPGGLVCIGIKESMPEDFIQRFECIDKKEGIYRKYIFLTD